MKLTRPNNSSKEFCKGVGEDTIDIANSSRSIKPEELEACKAAGVTDVMEVKIGYDGIVFAVDPNGRLALEPKDVPPGSPLKCRRTAPRT
jgi:phosphate transport system substrate-binding protein